MHGSHRTCTASSAINISHFGSDDVTGGAVLEMYIFGGSRAAGRRLQCCNSIHLVFVQNFHEILVLKCLNGTYTLPLDHAIVHL